MVNSSLVIPPIQLDAAEKRLLLEHMAVQQEMSPLKDEAKSLTAKLHISLKLPKNDQDTIVVHGRRLRNYWLNKAELKKNLGK